MYTNYSFKSKNEIFEININNSDVSTMAMYQKKYNRTIYIINMLHLLKFMLYIIFSIIAFHFIYANFSNYGSHGKEIISDAELIPGSNLLVDNEIDETERIEQELYNQSKQQIIDSRQESDYLGQQMIKNFHFKHKPLTQPNKQTGLLSDFFKYAGKIGDEQLQAPELENFDHYAPAELKCDQGFVRQSGNEIIPNSTDQSTNNYHNCSTPLPINEFTSVSTANFGSFDPISKENIMDPSEWDWIKTKENHSSLLSAWPLQPQNSGLLPSNQNDMDNHFENIFKDYPKLKVT